MALDPTSQNRAALVNGIRSVLPGSSPLNKSLEEAERAKQEQLAVDEANNLVMQRDEVALPQEAQGFINPVIASPARDTASIEDQYNIPAPVTPTTQTEVVTQSASPNYMQNAVNLETDVAKKAGSLEANAYNQIASGDQEYNRQLQEVQKQQMAAEDAWKQEYDSLKKDVDSKKIDPKKWWKDKSTGDKVLTIVGMAFASMSNDSFRAAMGAIDKTIERDINAQKADIDNGRMKLQDSKTLYAENLRRFGDQRVALASTRLMNAETIKNRLQAQMSGLKGDVAKANGMKMMAQVEQYQNKHALEVAKLVKEQAKENQGLTVVGYNGQFPSKEEAKTFREMAVTKDSSEKMINRLIEINSTPGKSMSPDLRVEAENIQKVLIGNLRVLLTGPGAMNESEQKLLNDVIANPTSILSRDSGNLTSLNTLKKSLRSKLDSAAKIYGVTPASQQITSFRPNK